MQATLPEDNDPPSLATSSSARTWAGLVYLILETARAQLAEHRAQGGEGEGPPMWAQVRSALLEFHRDGKGFLEFLLVGSAVCPCYAVCPCLWLGLWIVSRRCFALDRRAERMIAQMCGALKHFVVPVRMMY